MEEGGSVFFQNADFYLQACTMYETANNQLS
jgi:hypothetical protein